MVPSNVRAKAPTGGPEFEPYFRGANVLTDPSFENFRDNSGGWYWPTRDGGTTMYTLPMVDLACPYYLRWPDGSCATESQAVVGWCQTSGPYGTQNLDWATDPMWRVSTLLPYAGQYGAVWFRWSGAHNTIVPAELTAYSAYTPPFSCRVEPGDSVSWNARCRVSYASVPAGLDTPKIIMILKFYNSSSTLLTVSQSTPVDLTITYTNYTHATSAPSGSHYLRATVAFNGDGWPNTMGFVDSARLGIT